MFGNDKLNFKATIMILILMIITLLSCCGAIPFRHDIDFQHPESGEHVKLQSDGELRDTVDLDRIDAIKVGMLFNIDDLIFLCIEY